MLDGVIPSGQKCQEKGCKKVATDTVYKRTYTYDENKGTVIYACKDHTKELLRVGNPEYSVSCPNCDCLFGVN